MKDDLVERLREPNGYDDEERGDAADRIEALEAQLAALKSEPPADVATDVAFLNSVADALHDGSEAGNSDSYEVRQIAKRLAALAPQQGEAVGLPDYAKSPEASRAWVEALSRTPTEGMVEARPLEEWHEDYGDVVWWKFPIEEAAMIGNPLDSAWPGYHTHWTPHPSIPAIRNQSDQAKGE